MNQPSAQGWRILIFLMQQLIQKQYRDFWSLITSIEVPKEKKFSFIKLFCQTES